MRTKLKTIREEDFSDDKVFGVLLNYSTSSNIDNTANMEWKESFLYIFNRKKAMYVFVNTIIDLYDYILYGEGDLSKMKRAYMEESEFDQYYDAPFIEGTFNEVLEWI